MKDDRLIQLFTLCHIPRWAIIDCTRSQTVGEHTFRVMAICERICADIGFSHEGVLVEAFTHDMDEAKSGDIPTPYKNSGVTRPDTRTYHIVKLADYAEAVIFLRRYCVKSKRVESEIYAKMVAMCEKFPEFDMLAIMNQILFEGEHYE